MNLLFLTFVVVTLIGSALGLPATNSSLIDMGRGVSQRNPRFFPFYTLGRFFQDVCVGSNSLIGTCVLGGECDDLGGTSTGQSACSAANTRQASCCIVTKTCGGQTQYNNTYFVNSGYPATFPGGSRCNMQVVRTGTDICQLRISFLDFSLAQPTGDGFCSNDYFTVTGGSSPVPRICGENSGHHVYVDFSGDNPITISVATSGSFNFNRRWHFHLQMIGCDSPSRAPSGCLQFWMDPSGWVSSFNYASGASGVSNAIGVQGSRQIANLNYGACIKAAPGQCSITYSLPSDIYAFTVTGDVGAIDPAILGTAAVQEQNCLTDYVTIPDAQQNGVTTAGDRFCGLGIAATTSLARPFVVYSVTDGNETPDIASRSLLLVVAFMCFVSFGKKSKTMRFVLEVALILTVLTYCRAQDEYDYYGDDEGEEYDEEDDDDDDDGLYIDGVDNVFNDVYDRQDHEEHSHEHQTKFQACGSKIYDNNSILINPSYPQGYFGGSRCTYQVHRESHHICQLRIDFLAFSLAQPSGDGICNVDFFTIEGGSSLVPKICGQNTGQHVYVDVGGRLPITIVVATTSINSVSRRWQLQVSQIGCRSHHKAPANCLQYYSESSGFIRSFNYGTEESGNFNSIGVSGSRQIANLRYNICIRRKFGMCSITYKRPAGDAYAFTLTGDVKSVDRTLLGTLPLQSQDCGTDYIIIPAPSQVINNNKVALPGDRFCGLGIGEVISQNVPFNIHVVTDASEIDDLANRGFYLNYRQDICL